MPGKGANYALFTIPKASAGLNENGYTETG